LPDHLKDIVGQDSHEQPSLVDCEAATARLVPPLRDIALFDQILNIATTVIHPDYLSGRQPGIGVEYPVQKRIGKEPDKVL
jgi:hypothetical protein